MSTVSQTSDTPGAHELQCMEIWSGNRSVETTASSTGLAVWISSRPYLGESRGGDVHYLSLCVGGIVTRIVLADVSGHGNKVADTSAMLRKLLRRFMNAKKQDRLVAELNREFSDMEQNGRFATAVVATYLSHKKRLLLTNAGHPRPLGEQGLLSLVESIPLTTPFDQLGRELLSAVRTYSCGVTNDDETLMVIRFGRGRRSPGIMERLRGYAAVLFPSGS
jgi:hypothetical protein